jgi:uncharacterized lipoprotein NlpE involved in copper resistance
VGRMNFSGIVKKAILILLAVICVATLVACNNNGVKSEYALSYVEGKAMSIPFNDTFLDG